jgi:hypothetical protein
MSEVSKYIDILVRYWSVFIQMTFTKVNEVPGQYCWTISLFSINNCQRDRKTKNMSHFNHWWRKNEMALGIPSLIKNMSQKTCSPIFTFNTPKPLTQKIPVELTKQSTFLKNKYKYDNTINI